MIAKRLFFTGYSTSHLVRCVTYAIELGATVLHMGNATAFPTNPLATYTFMAVDEGALAALKNFKIRTPEAEELVTREAQRVAGLVADFAPDLCHVVGADWFMVLCIRAGLHPLLVSALGFLEHWIYEGPKVKGFDSFLSSIDALVVEPPMMVEVARARLPSTVRVEELSVGFEGRYFYPVDGANREAWRRALSMPSEATLIFSPRGWGATYGHDFVLSAFAQAYPDLPTPAYLFFTQMGRSGDVNLTSAYFEQVHQQAEELGVADHVRWLPLFPTVSMATLYNAADLVISYRAPDTFPVTVLEAMACSCPVIVSDLPSFAKSVIAKHCRLVPPKNSDELAAAIIDMVHHRPSVEALEVARQTVLARYDKPAVMQRLAAIYDSLAHLSPNLVQSGL